jgi:signal transduction histidine kinase
VAGYAVALGVISGLCLGVGLLHLFIGLRRRSLDPKHVSFGLFALAYGAAVLLGLLLYRSTSLDQYLARDRWSGVTAVAAYLALIWFVAAYTGVRPLPVLFGLGLAFIVVLVAHLLRPTGYHGEIAGLALVTLPWGEQLAFVDAAESVWETVFLLAQLATIGFLFYACFRQLRRGERTEALTLGAGLLFFVAALIVDILVEAGLLDFVLASDFGFVPLAVVMSLQLANEVIRTEEEVAGYRGRLEALVEERTVELRREVAERAATGEALRKRAQELAQLRAISRELASSSHLETALAHVCEAIALLLGVEHVYIVLQQAGELDLRVLTGYDSEAGLVAAGDLPLSLDRTRYFGRVLDGLESLALKDVQTLDVAEPMRPFLSRRGIENALLVPLVLRGSALGLLAAGTPRADRVFTPDDIGLAETVAGDLAAAVENAHLLEQAQEAAVSEERNRLARELHDSVTQILFSINLIASSLGRLWRRDPGLGERSTEELRRLSHGALAEMRTMLHELRPQTIAATELGVLLQRLCDGISARHDIPVELNASRQCGLPEEVHVALYRIAQEAIINIAKHAGAGHVSVSLACDDGSALLSIVDDGQGFDPDEVLAERMGLDIMRERSASIAAELTVDSQPGEGTSIEVRWRRGHVEGDHHGGA